MSAWSGGTDPPRRPPRPSRSPPGAVESTDLPPPRWYHYFADIAILLIILALPAILIARSSLKLASSRNGNAFRDFLRPAPGYRGMKLRHRPLVHGARVGEDFQAVLPLMNELPSERDDVLISKPHTAQHTVASSREA
jgi:hypothetical protein